MEVKHMLSQYYGMNASHLTIDEFSHELHIRKMPLDGSRSQLEKVLYNHVFFLSLSLCEATARLPILCNVCSFCFGHAKKSGLFEGLFESTKYFFDLTLRFFVEISD
uniref:(northern house mosquito) hypothetical protein n=1 Tax=Culex pipiens TaxID=7175 RepID=A0A8D8GV36_CULPI